MFISDKFIFDNVSCEEYNVRLVYFENNIINDMKIPFSLSLNSETINKTNPFYKEEYNIPSEITLNMAYVDKNGDLSVFTDEAFKRIKSWLITDYFAPFITEDYEDYVLYLKCTKIQDKLTFDNKGFLEVTFQPYTHYFYKKFNTTVLLSNEYSFDINNESDEICYPIITFENTGDLNNIVTINDLEISDVQNGEIITIDNQMLTVLNENKENKLHCCNRQWIKLLPGNNKINLTGNGKITFSIEFPIVL